MASLEEDFAKCAKRYEQGIFIASELAAQFPQALLESNRVQDAKELLAIFPEPARRTMREWILEMAQHPHDYTPTLIGGRYTPEEIEEFRKALCEIAKLLSEETSDDEEQPR